MRKYVQLTVVLTAFFLAVLFRNFRELEREPFRGLDLAATVGPQASNPPTPSTQPTATYPAASRTQLLPPLLQRRRVPSVSEP